MRVGELDGIDSIWSDMRPHPRLGTLEIRAGDVQSSLDDLEGIVALVHGLVRHEALVADDQHPPKTILDEACFRAIRDGLDGRFSVGGPDVLGELHGGADVEVDDLELLVQWRAARVLGGAQQVVVVGRDCLASSKPMPLEAPVTTAKGLVVSMRSTSPAEASGNRGRGGRRVNQPRAAVRGSSGWSPSGEMALRCDARSCFSPST